MIALDDLHPTAEALKLLPLASMVKVDMLLTPADQLEGFVKQLQKFPVKLLAEKVEDGSQVNDLLEMGFDYLQGFFFSKPILMKHRQMSTNQLAILQLLSLVYDDEIAPEKLENVICNDVTLSYHLLRYINSAFFNLPNKVESIRQAVVYLGRNELRTWTTVVSMAGNSDKPDELMNLALVRGKTCELLAKTLGMKNLDAFFTTGLLSVLDAMMDQTMESIIKKLPVSKDIQSALLKHEGILGEALSCSQAYEQGYWKSIKFKDLPTQDINSYYVEAIAWANEALKNIN